ncbi:protease SohB [Parashewanella curva]|uniref:protease SohB n=1 Tax=Parashewanella curva TaxID=2338552 RepID=UPI00140514D5|nr:protease SohB [Parashewanella curva]
MEFLYEYGLFLAKAVTLVVAIVAVILVVVASSTRHKAEKGELKITNVTAKLEELVHGLKEELLDKKAYKAYEKELKKQEKAKSKQEGEPKPKSFVIDFKGSIDAHEVESLRKEVSAVLAIATKEDEVIVNVESGGGMVHGYGLASSQLDRIRQAEIPLTVCVDKVAVSGGYMMACVANKIYAAPFAIVGSIGVVAQLPNFNRLLKKHDIDYEQHTAGDFKRTLTVFGENTEEGRQKFQQEIEETHVLFKEFVAQYRPELSLEKVATGEHWFGKQALELGLIDDIRTSDDLIMKKAQERDVYKVQYQIKKKLADKFAHGASLTLNAIVNRLAEKNRPV